MAALAAAKHGTHREGKRRGYPVAASTIIYKGAVVGINADGFAVPIADTANYRGARGFAIETIDNSSGADGDATVPVLSGISMKVAGSSLTQAMVGNTMMAVDDQTVAEALVTTNDIPAGVMEEYISASLCWLFVPLGGIN